MNAVIEILLKLAPYLIDYLISELQTHHEEAIKSGDTEKANECQTALNHLCKAKFDHNNNQV